MTRPGDLPASTPTTPVPTPVPSPVVTPLVTVDDLVTRAQLADLQLQESLVAQLLDVLDEAGRQVAAGAPPWVDPDVFGDTQEARRMARHTVRAQARVHQALDLALEALAQHHGALGTFRDEVHRVETTTVEQLTALRARVEGTPS